MNERYGFNRDMIWNLGVAMQRWRQAQIAETGAVDGEIGQIGILFRRYLEEKYGINVADAVSRAATDLLVNRQTEDLPELSIPFGLLLVTKWDLDPSTID